MTVLSKEQSESREKTLLAAVLLSMWGPLATGIAVVLSHSSTQLADFIRRTVELSALIVSWWVYRHLARHRRLGPAEKARLERVASLSVAGAMGCSGVVMLGVAAARLGTFEPGGNIYPGLAIAVLGLVTNAWFWRRYTVMTREHYSPIIAAQRQLYRAKSSVDLCVIVALATVAIAPAHPATRTIDLLGSVAVASYLLWSGARMARNDLNRAQAPGRDDMVV